MNDLFSQQLNTLEGSIATLSRRARRVRSDEDASAIRDALSSLQATAAVLRAQHEELLQSRAAAEREHRRYEELSGFAPDGYIVTGRAGIIQEVNAEAARLFGRDPAELLRAPLARFVRAEQRTIFRERVQAAGRGEEAEFSASMRGAAPGGFDAAIKVSPVHNPSGRTIGLRWLVRDISRQRRAEDLHTLHILESMGEGFYALDDTWRFVYVNGRAEALFGVARADLLGRSIWEIYATAPQDEARTAYIRARSEHRACELEHFAPALQCWLRLTLSPVDDRLYVAVQDISARKQAEEAVSLREAEHQQILDALPAGAWRTDAFGNTTFVNRHWLDYTGLTRDECAGRGWARAIHPDDLAALLSQGVAADSRRPAAGWQAEFRVRRRDGVYRWHLAEMEPLEDAGGSVASWVSVAVDIHDKKEADLQVQRLYDEARATSEQLQHANETKDEFLGLISHELKTPITTILGNSEILLRRSRELDDERRADALADIHLEAGRLHQIVEELLSLSRIERGQEVDLEPLLLGHLIERLIGEHRVRYPARAFDFSVRTTTAALGERLYVEQVVRNFLSNAEKYGPRELPITIDIRAVRDEVEVAISDRGSGLSEQEVTQVFMPFVRLERTANQASGSGIGLAVCKRLIEAQSGRIWARRREGGGSEFGFALRTVVETGNE